MYAISNFDYSRFYSVIRYYKDNTFFSPKIRLDVCRATISANIETC